jgi:hypothetical protein
MADGDTPGGAAGETPNTRQMPGGEPAEQPPWAYAGAYPPYSPYPPASANPAGMPLGAAGTAPQQPGPPQPQGQPFPNPPYGYPPYPYPSAAYPPAQYAYPYPYAAPQPARGSNRALWITLSAVGAVLLVVCVSCSVLVAISLGRAASSANQFLGPTLAATTFCVDVQDQDYGVAYDQFSRNLQSQMTRDAFVAAALAHDQASGRVTDCTPDTNSSPADTSGPPTLVHITITRGSDSGGAFTYRGDLTFVQEAGAWKLDANDASLGLT